MKMIIQKLKVVAFGVLLIVSALMLASSQKKSINTKPNNVSATKGIAVLELFTSQGCSSCPPADALLAEYADAHNEHIIPLSFHVDYWNRLGWADPFSNKSYSERQQWYSQYLHNESIYTPQLIVNGRKETAGNNRNAVNKLIQDALLVEKPATILVETVSVDKNLIGFHYKTANTNRNDLLNIALVQKQATTHIKAGENNGLTIANHNIVRSFATQAISNEGEGAINLPVSFKPSEYALVVYVQNKNDLSIIAAASKDL